ncbi:thiamine pyrophosphate-dependent enzyme [Paracraurococcus lichenis]|uniref:Thiamine pyrophosphate-binding protein n=1 Tax=Paracraurococcus lichenis TaxID=3064888 RepID=A0ABT9E026_9PROT|nr:thiamine pyrophosphate-dependent enzyme [Paracraurococcus sp. LOR1-02]MDO9709489.1 thiamine pyrophosphate-binding protein [Paracraurococcus sp. LOR1-02]
MSTAQAVVAGLLANGIETIYALPGVQNDPFFDALYHAQNRLRVIHTRHEQGAAYMALGAALATGRPQAMAVVPGPGLLNASAALATAYSTDARVLAISGQIPLGAIGRMTGQLHEIRDQTGLLRSMTKWNAMVTGPADAPAAVEEAFRQLLSGRPRPVALEVPMDVWPRTGLMPALRTAEPLPAPPVDEEVVEQAARLLGAAERPMLVVGGGAHAAREEVRRIAEALAAPVLSVRMGRGVLDGRHPLAVTVPAAHRLWAEADAVLVVGSRASGALGGWGTEGLKLVRVEIDAEEMHRFGAPTIGLQGDAAAILPALAERIAVHRRARPGRMEHIAGVKAEVMGRVAERLAPQQAFLRAMREVLPEDGILVDELTQVGYAGRALWPVHGSRTYLSSGYQGTLGWGLAAALGAKAARPEAPVLSISGDGGFMFNVQELATAVQHGIAVVAVVFTDNAYGNVRGFQKQHYGGRVIATELRNPDFVRLAESFGALGLRAEGPAALGEALRRGFANADGPTLIEVPVGEFPSPWEFLMLPKVRPAG